MEMMSHFRNSECREPHTETKFKKKKKKGKTVSEFREKTVVMWWPWDYKSQEMLANFLE